GNGNYGERVLSARFLDSFTIAKGLASKNKIAKNKNEVLTYLNYGYDTEEKSYVTQEFDTVAGIAWIKNITVQHLLSINNDKLRSADQLLPAGLTLNVKALNSPIQFEVVKEYQEERTVSPGEPEYIYDDTLQAGKRIVQQEAQLGLENVKLRERYINGVSVGGEEIASYRTKEPVREVIKVGTKILPNIGSGSFIWPVRNPIVTCGWGCYAGHQALDIQNRLDKYGRIYAADRGVIKVNSYHSINGYYYVIDHNNGYTTYYGHMAVPGFAAVGTTVAQGEEIGMIGETGLATGPHVHFEIRKNGVKLDPALFLP
ncbi:MAG: peptidoglycan DD-metalloendopeptidase family protein, partial [Erysipelotrichaceae bacterium]|nr:peptidoglycan DD-metalloendopeptidase family protein [Erysipelotrichaceae bacterium]